MSNRYDETDTENIISAYRKIPKGDPLRKQISYMLKDANIQNIQNIQNIPNDLFGFNSLHLMHERMHKRMHERMHNLFNRLDKYDGNFYKISSNKYIKDGNYTQIINKNNINGNEEVIDLYSENNNIYKAKNNVKIDGDEEVKKKVVNYFNNSNKINNNNSKYYLEKR